MRSFLTALIVIIGLGSPITAYPSNADFSVPTWLELLRKGNEREKKLALERLYLKYYVIKDLSFFNPILRALKDKNSSLRAAAADCLKRFGEDHEELYGDKKKNRDILKRWLKDDEGRRKFAEQGLGNYDARDIIVLDLVKALSDNEPMVRAEPALALGYYYDERSIDALIESLRDKDPWVRLNAVYSLKKQRARKSLEPLLKVLEDDSDWRYTFAQQESILALSNMGILLNTERRMYWAEKKMEAPPALGMGSGYDIEIINVYAEAKHIQEDEPSAKTIISSFIKKSSDPYLKRLLLQTFGRSGIKEARDVVVKATGDADAITKKAAIEALSRLDFMPSPAGDIKIMPSLSRQSLQRRTLQVKPGGAISDHADTVTDQLNNKNEAFEIFKKSLSDPSGDVRARAATGLGNMRDPRAVDLLVDALKDPSTDVRACSAEALGHIYDSKAIDPLISALQDRDNTVKKAAAKALGVYGEDKILRSLPPLWGMNAESGLSQSAAMAFESVARNGNGGNVYVYRENGVRHVTKESKEGYLKRDFSSRMVHPVAVEVLTDVLGRSSQEEYRVAFGLLSKFEDPRIEKTLIKLLSHPSPDIRTRAIAASPSSCGASAIPLLIKASSEADPSIRRKAVFALGSFQDDRILATLSASLKDADKVVRSAALQSLEGYPDPMIRKKIARKTVETIINYLRDPDSAIAYGAAEALGAVGNEDTVEPLIDAAEGRFNNNDRQHDTLLKQSAIKSLARLNDKRVIPSLIKAFEDPASRSIIIRAFASMKDTRAVPVLVHYIKKGDYRFQFEAIQALGQIGDPTALDALSDLLNHRNSVHIAIQAIGEINSDRALNILISTLDHPDDNYSGMAVQVLSKRKDKKAIKPLVKHTGKKTGAAQAISFHLKTYDVPERVDILIGHLKDADKETRKGAVIILGEFGNKKAIGPLTMVLKDPDPEVRSSARDSLGKLEGQSIH